MTQYIPILMYHQITPQPHPAFRKYGVTPTAFAAQMKWLARFGYRPIDLDHFVAYRQGRAEVPRKPILITFDDGYQDWVDYAAPILQAQRFTAIFFLVAGLMGATTRWLLAERNIEFPLLDWDAAREMERQGFQIGSHTMSHPHLADVSPDVCREELREARQMLENQLGHTIEHIAYPYGSYNAAVRTIAQEIGYVTACSVRMGLSAPDDDLLALHRVPIAGQDTLVDFICRLRTARSIRELLQDARYRMSKGVRSR